MMKTLAIAVNQRFIREGFVPLMVIFALLLLGATTVDAKESIKFVHELKANLKMPVDVALAPNGDVYVLDQKASQVHVFNQAGELSFSFAEYGSGWGKLIDPQSLAISRDGDVIIADTGNKRVQVFNSRGSFIYELGNSGDKPGQFIEPTLVSIDAYGYIFVADVANKTISKFSPKGVFFQATPLEGRPADMLFDVQQNMYILYPESGRIVKRPMDGGYTETIEFSWEGRNYLTDSTRISVDMRGDIYLIDRLKDSVVKIDQDQHLLLSFGSKGIGRGQFDQPIGIIADDQGKIYVADSRNKRVQVIEVIGSQKVALDPVEGKAPVVDYARSISAEKSLSDIKYDEKHGLFALSETTGHILHQKKSDLFVYGDFDNKSLLMNTPSAMQILKDGKLLVADTGNNRLQFLNADGSHDYSFGTKGVKDGQFDSLSGVAVNNEGQIYIADTRNNRIQIFNSDGIYLKAFGQKGENTQNNKSPKMGYFNYPKTLEFDSKGLLYVLDSRNRRIQVFDQQGTPIKEIGAIGDLVEFNQPVDLALDEWDNLYIADQGTHTVKVLDNKGKLVTEFGSAGKGRSYFPRLSSISVAQGKIYVADYDMDEIKVFDIHINDEQIKKKMALLDKEMDKSEEKIASKADTSSMNKKKLMLAANEASANETPVPDKVVKIEQPKTLEQKTEDAANLSKQPEMALKNGVQQDQDRIYFTQVSYPLKTENMDDKIKYQMMHKMTLQLAIVNVANQYGMAVEEVTPHVKVEKEDMLDDGRLRITVSVPKDLSKAMQSTQAEKNIKVSQLK